MPETVADPSHGPRPATGQGPGTGERPATGQRPRTGQRPGTIRQGDRDKALRPLSFEARRAAFESGLAAYARGDFFEAHEDLEPAWMGTDDLAERALHQGLIKVAAAYVHAVRGNPAGITRNLVGARKHLANAGPAGDTWGVDVATLLAEVDARLADPTVASAEPAPAIGRTHSP